ncbi:hypothetical protein AMTR_s00151p00022910 [Amborella trichopoda]|uniref:Uncharacterized protein n=1 Tax=Amborella trichopoda TaxID=13333 RepID=W1NJ48_AMBTC|nr:hypothetical protein AMTR_s00151p00022910 [Amborella trichopoda]
MVSPAPLPAPVSFIPLFTRLDHLSPSSSPHISQNLTKCPAAPPCHCSRLPSLCFQPPPLFAPRLLQPIVLSPSTNLQPIALSLSPSQPATSHQLPSPPSIILRSNFRHFLLQPPAAATSSLPSLHNYHHQLPVTSTLSSATLVPCSQVSGVAIPSRTIPVVRHFCPFHGTL